MMALLLLLVATVVSIVIVTVALTSTMHVTDNKTSQQEYLACVSAAEMLRDGLNGSTYEYSITSGKYQEYTPSWDWKIIDGKFQRVETKTLTVDESLIDVIGPDDGKPRTTSDILEKFVTELSESIRVDTNRNTETNLLTKNFTITQSDENVYDVSVKSRLVYDSSSDSITENGVETTTNYYNLKINLFTRADESSQGYRMSMTIPVTEKIDTATGTTSYDCQEKDSTTGTKHYTRTGRWPNFKYTPQKHNFSTTTATTTVTWGMATISKGWS